MRESIRGTQVQRTQQSGRRRGEQTRPKYSRVARIRVDRSGYSADYSVTRTYFSDTPFLLTSMASCTFSRPWPGTRGSGMAT